MACATCTSAHDERRIRAELRDDEDEVDRVVDVLSRSSLTTDYLRKAAHRGVQVDGVGFQAHALTFVAVGYWLIVEVFYHLILRLDEFSWTSWPRRLLPLAWLATWFWLPRDRRVFASRTLVKVLLFSLTLPQQAMSIHFAPISTMRFFAFSARWAPLRVFVGGVLSLALACTGVLRIAYISRRLARVLDAGGPMDFIFAFQGTPVAKPVMVAPRKSRLMVIHSDKQRDLEIELARYDLSPR